LLSAVFMLLWPLLLSAVEVNAPLPPRNWLSVDAFHVSRTLPSLSRTVESPVNPGLRARFHHAWFGRTLAAASSVQTTFSSYDELFWSLALGAGFEGVFRPDFGLYASLGLRLEYERVFTGDNNFELDGERYRQRADSGRGFLRVTPVDLTCGYSPKPLQRLGLIPGLRYAWAVALPFYENEDANAWSYSEFGVTLLWAWRAGQ
jgi:hypothetical protein